MTLAVEPSFAPDTQRLAIDRRLPPSASLLLRLRRRDQMTFDEGKVVTDLVPPATDWARRADLVSEGDRPTHSVLLVEGFAARYKVLDQGGRQMTALHVPGDFVDLHSLLLKQMDHGVLALTECRISKVPHERLRRLTETQPHLSRLLWLMTLIDGAIHREWVVSMGRRTAKAHMANFFAKYIASSTWFISLQISSSCFRLAKVILPTYWVFRPFT